MRVKNPYSPDAKLNSDGRTYSANPDYLAFESLSENGKLQFLARRSLGMTLTPPKLLLDGKPISYHWRDHKSFANELMRACRFLTGSGQLLAEFWADRVFGEHLALDESDRRAYTELLARYARYPTAAPVNEKGDAVAPQEVNVLAFIGRNPTAFAAALALQRALESGASERRGEVVEGVVVESTAFGLSEREASGDVAETSAPDSQDAPTTRKERAF